MKIIATVIVGVTFEAFFSEKKSQKRVLLTYRSNYGFYLAGIICSIVYQIKKNYNYCVYNY